MTPMEQQMNYIVTQCYGDAGVFHECAYALLSFSRLYSADEMSHVQIWIYTDKPEWFRAFKDCWLPLHFRTLDEATLAQWRGKIDFVHRVKIEVLKDATHDKHGNILYCDTDVVFTHRIGEMLKNIAAGNLYMHVMEGIVSEKSNPILAKLYNHLQENALMQVNGKPIYDLAMWNAGVLGFNTSYRYLLDEVLTFTDSEYPKFPKHVVEQFAFSVYFQQVGPVKTAAPYIVHYWNLKEARLALASFFEYFKNTTWDELTQYSMLLQMHVLMQEKTNYLLNRTVADKLQKKQWHPAPVNWKEMMKQVVTHA